MSAVTIQGETWSAIKLFASMNSPLFVSWHN